MESEIDAVFYRLVHEVLLASRADRQADRRKQRRSAFSTRQRVAPWDGRQFPEPSQFFEVQCHDLTQGGFSFLLPQPPDFAFLVAELTTPVELIFLAAEVRHYCRVWSRTWIGPAGELGRVGREEEPASVGPEDAESPGPIFLVGCRFVRRLPKPVWAETHPQLG